jgi:hypothetical protein
MHILKNLLLILSGYKKMAKPVLAVLIEHAVEPLRLPQEIENGIL